MLKRYQESYPDSLWLTNELPGISNYMVANGLRTIDSTNVYPNLELFENQNTLVNYMYLLLDTSYS